MAERLIQMRNIKELKDIVLKIEIIEKIKEPLQKLLHDINTLLQQGHEWMNNIGNKTYQEMKQQLDSEMAKFLRQCFCIASYGHERCSETALTEEELNQATNFVSVDMRSTRDADDKDNKHVLEHLEELTANFTSHTEMLQTMKQKIKDQEKSLKSISKLKQQTEAKFEKMMKELHEASNFMSTLSEELNETKELIQDKKIEEISQNVVNYLEQRDLIAKKQEKVETLKREIKRLTDELESMNEKLTTQECKIDQLKGEKDEVLQALMIKEQDFVKLQTECGNIEEKARYRHDDGRYHVRENRPVKEMTRYEVPANRGSCRGRDDVGPQRRSYRE